MDNTNDVEKEFFTVKDIQIYLGIGQNTAYALLKKLPTVYIGGYKVRKSDLDSWINYHLIYS